MSIFVHPARSSAARTGRKVEAGLGDTRSGLRAPAFRPAWFLAGADRARRSRHSASARASGARRPSPTCICLLISTPDQVADQILQPVPVVKVRHQPGRDLGAIDRRGHNAKIGLHTAMSKRAKWNSFSRWRVGQQRLQIGRVIAVDNLHQMRLAVAPSKAESGTDGRVADSSPSSRCRSRRSAPDRGVRQIVDNEEWEGKFVCHRAAAPGISVNVRVGDPASRYATGAQEKLELPRPFGHWYLKPARLPIPPPGQRRRSHIARGSCFVNPGWAPRAWLLEYLRPRLARAGTPTNI